MSRFIAATFWLLLAVGGCAPEGGGREDSQRPSGKEEQGNQQNSPPASTPRPADRNAASADRPADQLSPAGRLYDGLTLEEWRERIKDLNPDDPASADAVNGLMQIVRDANVPWYSRRQAALTLGRIGPPAKEAIPLLIALLDETGEGESATSQWAAKALALFGSEAKAAAPTLIRRLENESVDEADRRTVIEPLSQIGTAHPQVVPALIHTLSSSTAADELRGLAAEALALIGPAAAAAVPALMRTARADEELLRRRSITALGAMGPLAEVAVPTLAESMVLDESAAVRDQAADSLARIGKASVPLLVHLLADEDAEVRWRAALALGKIGPPADAAASSLKMALDDPHPEVRMHAIEALWAVQGDPATIIGPLLAEFVNEDRQIRIRAYRLLISLEEQAEPAKERLRELLTDERGFVRQVARQALEELADSDGEN